MIKIVCKSVQNCQKNQQTHPNQTWKLCCHQGPWQASQQQTQCCRAAAHARVLSYAQGELCAVYIHEHILYMVCESGEENDTIYIAEQKKKNNKQKRLQIE